MRKVAGRVRGRMPSRTQRGDVPGWVLITVMTAALVAGLLAIAGPELNQMLREALASVH
jgi:Tfp pilus assembly protein PilX